MRNKRKPMLIGLVLIFIAAGAIMAVTWPGTSPGPSEPGKNPNSSTTTTGEKKALEPRIPPIDPKKDVIIDEEGIAVVKGVLWIFWKQGVDRSQKQAILKSVKVRGEIEEFGFSEIEVGEDDLKRIQERLERLPEVEAVTRGYLADPDFKPGDPDYLIVARQWPYHVAEAEEAWDINRGKGSRIAVIDVGFQLDHPDLMGAFVPGEAVNYSTERLDKDADHGTHVSGIIGMRTNRIGLAGIAPESKIIPLKPITFAQTADAIRLASSMRGVRTINMSMGVNWWSINKERAKEGKPPLTEAQMKRYIARVDRILMPAAEFARKNDVAFVHSAGNDAVDVAYSVLNTDTVITVANLGKNDKLAPTSNFGAPVTLGAPGQEIWSAVGGSDFGFMSGTSMAAPMVAGTVALIRTVNPDLTAAEIRELLKETADPGKGGAPPRLNVWQALLRAGDQYGVKGKVVDENGNPVKGVLVRPKGRADLAVRTGDDGRFTLSAVPRSNNVELEAVEGKREPLLFDLGPLADNQFVLRDINIQVAQEEAAEENPVVSESPKAELWMSARLPARYEGDASVKRKLEYLFSTEPFSASWFTGKAEPYERILYLVNDIEYSGEVSELAVGSRVLLNVAGFLHENHSKDKQPIPVTMQLEGVITGEPGYSSGSNKVEITKLTVDPYTIHEDLSFGGEGGEYTFYYEYTPEDFAESYSRYHLKLDIDLSP